MYTPITYTVNVYNNTFWCPTTGTSSAVFGVTCAPLVIDSVSRSIFSITIKNIHLNNIQITPASFLNTEPASVEVAIAVKDLKECDSIKCYVDGPSKYCYHNENDVFIDYYE